MISRTDPMIFTLANVYKELLLSAKTRIAEQRCEATP